MRTGLQADQLMRIAGHRIHEHHSPVRLGRYSSLSGLGIDCSKPPDCPVAGGCFQTSDLQGDQICQETVAGAAQDPNYILNTAGFVATQNAAVAQDIATAGPQLAPGLELLTQYPTNIGMDANICNYSPGLTFTDQAGVVVTCPSGSVSTPTGPQSNLTEKQLLDYLQSHFGGPKTLGNQPVASTPPAASVSNPAPVTPGGTVPQSAMPTTLVGTSQQSNTSGSPSGLDLSFLTGSSLISGVPNWVLFAGALAALMILPSVMGGRR